VKLTSLFVVILIVLGIFACSQDEPGYLTDPGDPSSATIRDDHSGGKDGPGDIHLTSGTPEIGGMSHVGIILVEFANTPPDKRFDAGDETTILNFMFDDSPGAHSVHNLFQEMSYDVDGFTGEIIGTYEISWDYSSPCPGLGGPYFDWNTEAMDSAAVQGVVISPDDYDLLVFMTPSGGTCDGSGAPINGIAFRMAHHPIDIPQVSIFNWDVPTTTAHEIGHIRGFGHSGVQGINAYADLSCVMGDNYDYTPPVTALPMRQVNAYWKNYAGYFLPEDNLEINSAGGTYTVYLAPTERSSTEIEEPPGEIAYHMLTINSANQSQPYYISFRSSDPAYTDFDNDPAFAGLMDRVHVQTGGSDVYRRGLFAAGQSYEGENFKITAVDGGLSGDPWVEVTVEMYDKISPSVSVSPWRYVTANSSAGVAPETYTVYVINNDPAGAGPTTFDLSGTGTPDDFIVEFSSSQITLEPGEYGTVTASLNFSSAPTEQNYVVSVTASDPIGPRLDGTGSADYIVDRTPPTVPTGLNGIAGASFITLNWNPSSDPWMEGYYVERDSVVIDSTWQTTYTDNAVAPNTTYEYRVKAYDKAGNESGWSSPLAISTDCTAGFTAEFTPMVLYRSVPISKPGQNPGSYSMSITNNNSTGCSPIQYTGSATADTPGYFLNITYPEVASGDTEVTDVNLTWYPYPWVPPTDGTVTIGVQIDDPESIVHPQTFTLTYVYDTVDPTQPGNLVATVTATDVTLSWTASFDATAGVSHYEVLRDGNPVDTTPDLTYTDNFAVNSCVTYEVRAYDHAGRFSTAASVVVGAAPTVWIEPETMLTGETTFDVTLFVTNNDGAGCGSGTFDITPVSNPDVTIIPASSQLVVNAGETGSTTATVTIIDSPADGDYTIEFSVDDPVISRVAQTASATYTVDTVNPTEPGDLEACLAASDVTLTWTASYDATAGISHYEVLRDENSLGTTSDLTWTDNYAVTSPVMYEVLAYDNAGNFSTAASAVVEWTTPTVWIEPETMLTGQTTFDVTLFVTNNNPGCGSETFDITSVSNPDLTIAPAVSQLVVDAGDTESTTATVTITDSPADGDYTIGITVDDPATPPVAQTASVTYTVDAVAPTAPTNLTAAMSPFEEVTLNWDAASDATSGVAYYEIRRNDVVVGTTTDLTYVDNVDTFQALWYHVRAVDNAGNPGPWSNRVKTGCPGCPRPIEI
jgi:hypothetical protein